MITFFTQQGRRVNLIGLSAVIIVFIALYLAFIYAPTDRVQGEVQRVFYIHVPMAWLAYLAYAVILVGSIGYLWKRDMKWDRLARSSAELGFLFTSLVLITGAIWGRPIWGAWWQWEARLTTTLILWFIYLGYFLVRSFAGDLERAARYSAVLGIIGAIDIPIIHQSVEWWRTIHPEPIVLDTGGPNLPDSMLYSMLTMLLGMTLFYVYLMIIRVRIEEVRDQLVERELDRLLGEPGSATTAPTGRQVTGETTQLAED